MVKVLLTGGAGHIGSHVAAHLLENTDCRITFLDKLDFSGNLNRIEQSKNWKKHKSRCRFVFHDLRGAISEQLAKQIGEHDTILHLAALTDVDRSIADPIGAVLDNVVGTASILEFARRGCDSFVCFSTDEVVGPAPVGVKHKETATYACTNPYSATKAGAEQLARAYWQCYKVPVITTRTMNNFGEMQHVSKYCPMVIRAVLDQSVVNIHSDPTLTKPGSRHYIHARNTADALLHILDKGTVGEIYNIVGERECDNLEFAKLIAGFVGKPLQYKLVDAHSSRPGHDPRYALDGTKLAELGWKPPITFEQSLERTVKWTVDHPNWLAEPMRIAA